MTDVSNLDELAAAISTGSPKIRNYAIAQAAATQSQEVDIQTLLASLGSSQGVYNVRDYGAVGDGVADDTTAIQNALNAGSIVFLPAGDYLITDQLDVPVSVVVLGSGAGTGTGSAYQTRIVAKAAGFPTTVSMISMGGGSVLEHIFVDGNDRATWGVLLNNESLHSLSKVVVRNCTDVGFAFNGTQNSTLWKCASYDNNVGFALFNHTANCSLFGCDVYGVSVPLGGRGVYMGTSTDARLDTSLGPARNNRFFGGIYESDSNQYQLEFDSGTGMGNILNGIEITGAGASSGASIYMHADLTPGSGPKVPVTFYGCDFQTNTVPSALVDGGYLILDKCYGSVGALQFPSVKVGTAGAFDSSAVDDWHIPQFQPQAGGDSQWVEQGTADVTWNDTTQRLELSWPDSGDKILIVYDAYGGWNVAGTGTGWARVEVILDGLTGGTITLSWGLTGAPWVDTIGSISSNGLTEFCVPIHELAEGLAWTPSASGVSADLVWCGVKAYQMPGAS